MNFHIVILTKLPNLFADSGLAGAALAGSNWLVWLAGCCLSDCLLAALLAAGWLGWLAHWLTNVWIS